MLGRVFQGHAADPGVGIYKQDISNDSKDAQVVLCGHRKKQL